MRQIFMHNIHLGNSSKKVITDMDKQQIVFHWKSGNCGGGKRNDKSEEQGLSWIRWT